MAKVLVDADLVKEALAHIEAQDAYITKLASLELELQITHDVLNLVRDGFIDIDDAHNKIAEFMQSPDTLTIFKKAVTLTAGENSLGKPVAAESDFFKTASYGTDPEARLFSNISQILN